MKRRFKAQFDKRPVKDGHFPCDDRREGDGEDPKFDGIKAEWPNKVVNRKALQLCAQIADILNLTFAQLANEVLQGLYVAAVVPAPDSSQMLVTLVSPQNASEIMENLQKANGYLRSEVALGINRKRVPQLKFQVVTP